MRSSTGRRTGISRVNSLKPVTLPTSLAPTPVCSGLRHQHTGGDPWNAQDALVFVWEHFDELRKRGLPILQNPFGLRTIGKFVVPADQAMQQENIRGFGHGLEIDLAAIAIRRSEIAGLVEHVGDASSHPGGTIASRAAH